MAEGNPILFACPTCKRRLRVAPRYAGQLLTCPKCSSFCRVPDGNPPEPPFVADVVQFDVQTAGDSSGRPVLPTSETTRGVAIALALVAVLALIIVGAALTERVGVPRLIQFRQRPLYVDCSVSPQDFSEIRRRNPDRRTMKHCPGGDARIIAEPWRSETKPFARAWEALDAADQDAARSPFGLVIWHGEEDGSFLRRLETWRDADGAMRPWRAWQESFRGGQWAQEGFEFTLHPNGLLQTRRQFTDGCPWAETRWDENGQFVETLDFDEDGKALRVGTFDGRRWSWREQN